ncbi:acyltransferase domain-containing protein [Actinosynnema sp. NPDC023587]|uniref:acyltransferase domain-containing protein n=1 Tax=Actinosynnema sp. NPDC023587 TaxID=3154695 RepID=UPI0033DFF6CC
MGEVVVGVFPGQGSYSPGSFSVLLELPVARQVVHEVDAVARRVLGHGLEPVLGETPLTADELLATAPDIAQVAAFATSVALYEVLAAEGVMPSLLVGHSLGEISALVAAGALSTSRGAEVLCHRIVALRECDTSGGRMVALSCDRDRAERIIALLPTATAVVAVGNGPRQTTVSGTADEMDRVRTIAAAIGVAATSLRAPHPFHGPLLERAREEFAHRIEDVRAGDFAVPVHSPILGRHYRAGERLADALSSHLVCPVDFGAAVERLHTAGARIWVEVGAGRTLINIVRAIRPDALGLAPLASGTSSIAEVVDFLRPPPAGHAQVRQVNGSVVRLPLITSRDVPVLAGPVGVEQSRPAPRVAPETAQALEPTLEPTPDEAADAITDQATVAAGPVDREELAARVRSVYAAVLEYPEDVFEDDAALEADLGVDSVKQTELFARIGQELGMGVRPDGLRVSDYPTFGGVVDFFVGSLRAGAR